MAKEKKLIPKSSKKDFFYEISGTLSILLCLILLSELGSIGVFLKILFKVIFGDFYFIVVFYIIVHGIIALVKEKWFDFKSLRFNGIILLMLSIFMLVHISFLDLYNITSNSILSNTIDIYKESIFESNNEIVSYGGGLIGAIITQIFVVLFNRLGTIIFGIMFIFLSFSMITNLSISSLFRSIRFIFSKTKKFTLVIYRYFKNINFPNKRSNIRERTILINLNLLTDIETPNNDLLQLKIANDEKDAIISLIYQSNCYINNEKVMIGYSSLRYIFIGNFNPILINKIEILLNRRCIIYLEKNRLLVETSCKLKKLLSLKTLLLMNLSSEIPIGIEINGQILYFSPFKSQNILISGEKGSGVKTFLKSFIVTLFFRLKDEFNLIICDFLDEFNDLKDYERTFLKRF